MATTTLIRYDIAELNAGNVPGFPVKDGWDDISLYYAKALQEMGWINPPKPGKDVTTTWKYSEKPTSYYFQAAMHWSPRWPRSLPPLPFKRWWNHCTHGPASSEPFFLPWHRAYTYWFEVIIRSYVAKLGGPDDWSLPYWNYSGDYDRSNPSSPWPKAKLPFIFCQPTLPDGTRNPLFIADTVKRGFQPSWPPPHTAGTMFLVRSVPYYDAAYAFSDYSRFNSTLDGTVHGGVHDDVGTGDLKVTPDGGWMSNPVTASFDPIFWLHHSEIDRFWVGWNANGHPNPTDPRWLTASGDPQKDVRWFFWDDDDVDHPITVHPGDMLDPANLGDKFPYSYTYQDLPEMPPPSPEGAEVREAAIPRALVAEAVQPIAGTGTPVELGHEPVTTSIDVSVEPGLVAEAEGVVSEIVLYLDDVVSGTPPGDYDLYLNYPDATLGTGGSVPHYVGLMAGFGGDHEHGEEGEHAHADGHGLSFQYDVTHVVGYLRTQGQWDESEASLTFVPAVPPTEGELVTGPLRVGRIRISSA
jgi:tyrosinase